MRAAGGPSARRSKNYSTQYFTDTSCIKLLGHEYDQEYENPFEVENRLVRISLRLVDKIKAMRLQRVLNNLFLYNAVEIQRDGERSEGGQSTPSSPSDLQLEEIMKEEAPIVQAQQRLFTPIIIIGF